MNEPGLLTRAWRTLVSRPPKEETPGVAAPAAVKPARTILIAWELGAGMGHIRRLLPIATRLGEAGYVIVFALRKVAEAGAVRRALPGVRIIQAPFYARPAGEPPVQAGMGSTYADVLFRCGYNSAEKLGPQVRAWRQLLAEVAPTLVVCDHSPTVVLAAAGRVPVVHIGSGFATPPAGKPFRLLNEANANGARDREALVLASVREVQTAVGGPVPDAVSGLLGLADNITCNLPELDPYRGVRAEPAAGSVQPLPSPQPIGQDTFLFGYLAGEDPRVPSLLQSVAQAKIPAGIYVRQPDAACLAAVAGSTVTLYPTPQNLTEIMGRATAILHHGGLSTTEVALAIGRPQIILSLHLEQLLTADAVESLGCGVNLRRQKRDPGELISKALARGAYRTQAAAVAQRIAARPKIDVAAQIVERCLKHLESRAT